MENNTLSLLKDLQSKFPNYFDTDIVNGETTLKIHSTQGIEKFLNGVMEITNNNSFKPFHIGLYDDYDDLLSQLSDDRKDGFNPQKISVCIGEQNTENINAQKKMLVLK